MFDLTDAYLGCTVIALVAGVILALLSLFGGALWLIVWAIKEILGIFL